MAHGGYEGKIDRRRTTPAQEGEGPAEVAKWQRAVDRLRELEQALREDWDFDQLDPDTQERLLRNYRQIADTTAKGDNKRIYKGLSMADVVALMAEDMEAGLLDVQRKYGLEPKPAVVAVPEAAPAVPQRRLGEKLALPRFGGETWQIIQVDDRGTYLVVDAKRLRDDRREVGSIVGAIRAGEMRGSQPVGYEFTWDELEDYARSRT